MSTTIANPVLPAPRVVPTGLRVRTHVKAGPGAGGCPSCLAHVRSGAGVRK